jgi:hypothetical protein
MCKESSLPYINRFLSADTIVPGYSNPQNLNRYSYVTNNPLRYTDPTGHMQVQDGPQQDRFKPSVADKYRPRPRRSGHGGNTHPSLNDLLAVVDDLAWDKIPSAIGLHGNVTWNFGGGIEGNYTPMELMILGNWRSGEISIMVSMEGSGMLTVPDLVGVSLNGGVTEVYGASSNSRLEGWSNFSGYSISVGEGINVGASRNYGKGKESFMGGDYIDPISNRNVRFRQSAIFGAANIPLFPTPIDGSGFFGKSYTSELIRISFPNWPLK